MTTTDLTLPGGYGWIRGCSPVIWDAPDGGRYQGVVGNLYEGGARVIITQPYPVRTADYREREGTLSALHLRLHDATGRTHAAWWLADRLYDDGPFVAVAIVPGTRLLAPYPHFGLSTITALGGERWRALDCPALDDLDAEDPRLLPDGSRWVDAEALRRVCLHEAGLEVTP